MAVRTYRSSSKTMSLSSLIKQNSSQYRKALYGILVGLLLVMYGINLAPESTELMIMGLLGNSPAEGVFGLVEIALFILPMLVQLCLFGTVTANDMNSSGILIFTRTQSRKRRMAEQLITVAFCSVLFDIFTIIPIIIGCIAAGIKIASTSSLALLILSWFCGTVLCHVVFVLVMNILTIKFKQIPCMTATCILYSVGFVIAIWFSKLLDGWLVVLYPSVQGMIGIHNIDVLAEMFPYYFTNSVHFFTAAFSAIYSCILTAILFVIGLKLIDKHDFLN